MNFTPLGNATRTGSWYFSGTALAGNYIRLRGFYPDHSNQKSVYESGFYIRPQAVPFDFDGDGKTEVGIFRASDGSWWYSRSSDNQVRVFSFGTSSDNLAPADFTGDGRSDIAVFRPSTGFWFIQRSEDNSFFSFLFGTAGDIPTPADFDGDRRTDAAVFRPSNATWFINRSTAGVLITSFGAAGDRPIPNAFVP